MKRKEHGVNRLPKVLHCSKSIFQPIESATSNALFHDQIQRVFETLFVGKHYSRNLTVRCITSSIQDYTMTAVKVWKVRPL